MALSIMIQVLKQALIPVDLEVVTEVCYSRGFLPGVKSHYVQFFD